MKTTSSAVSHSPDGAESIYSHNGLPLFNMYRKGLQLFVLYTRDRHPKGMIWAGTAEAARGRANTIVGSESFVARANGSK